MELLLSFLVVYNTARVECDIKAILISWHLVILAK